MRSRPLTVAAFSALLALGVFASLSSVAAAPILPNQVAADALRRDRLRAQQSAPLTVSRASARMSSTATVPSSLVGLALADLTVGPGSTLEKAQQSGAGWMLGWISWQNLEPAEGQFAWNQGTGNDVDNLIRAAQAANLRVLARLQNVPAWATTDGSGRLVTVRADALTTFGQALAAHTAGRVQAFEIFNEPNLNYEWGQDLDASGPPGYARLLRAAYVGIKAGDASATVVAAGLADGAGGQSMDDLQYLRGLYAAGARGGTHFDALGTHPYGGSYPPEQDPTCGGTCLRHAELQRQIMLDNGDAATPMWATEVGWLLDSSNDLGPSFNWMKVSAQRQADYLVGAMQFAAANWPWMQRLFVFNLDHSTAMWCGGPCYPPNTSVGWFSILNPDRTPRLAYTALRNMLLAVQQTVTFDDLASPNRALTGQYPTGVIDWGSGAWYLSGPYGQLRTNSISFNGAGPTSASFSFVAPRQLVQLDAFNGGTTSSSVSLGCAGQPTRSVSLGAGHLATIATGWSGTCASVTVTSSNGWDTNFDSLVIVGGGSAATSTPTPTATSTLTPTATSTLAPAATPTTTRTATSSPIATSTPGGGALTVTFDDLPSPDRPLTGQYPTGVIDWGSGAWYLSSPYGQFRTNSVSFNGDGPTSASFTFVASRRLLQLDAYNGGTTASTLTVSCTGQPTRSFSLAAGQLATLVTNWTGSCSSVSVTSSNGWYTNFDNLLIQ